MTKKEKYNGHYDTEVALNKPAATVVSEWSPYKLQIKTTKHKTARPYLNPKDTRNSSGLLNNSDSLHLYDPLFATEKGTCLFTAFDE